MWILLSASLAVPLAGQPRPQPARPGAPLGRDEIEVEAVTQAKEGPWFRLRGRARLETTEVLLRADEVDYNEDTGQAEGRGNAYLHRLASGEELWAERVEYNLRQETGKFYNVRGSVPAPAAVEVRPGVLTTTNPYYFEGRWAERLKDRYILHDGFLTNCRLPKPWWVLRGPKFDLIPNQRALAYRSTFWVRKVPLFYTPYFYKSLKRLPRRSGLLTPNLGNSSRRGKMLGAGYYWAINRSYDAMYRGQYFTQRGFAHHLDVRGKPRAGSDFNAILYGVNDRGLKLESGERIKQGGVMMSFDGTAELGGGFQARADVNYLSSLTFRQAFTESFNEAVGSEVHSVGFVGRHWSTYGLDIVFQRLENFQSLQPDDTIVIRKLPQVEFSSRDRQLWSRGLPVWVSFQSSAGLVRRKQPLFQTRQYLERADLEPRVMTALRWKEFHLIPSFSLRETHWGESRAEDRILGA
ncbi:MAG: LPS assembly protein LptD, partial [Acidobacteriota bacterium]